MRASPSSVATRPLTLQELTAEAHRLYALLMPTGQVQVILPPGEHAKMHTRYLEVCGALAQAQAAQQEQKATAEKWGQEAAEALPELIPMLPEQFRGPIEALSQMEPGAARDQAMRSTLQSVINSGALTRLGPMGVALRPMLSKFLRTKKL